MDVRDLDILKKCLPESGTIPDFRDIETDVKAGVQFHKPKYEG